MFSFGEKKVGHKPTGWDSADETGMFHTMQDDLTSIDNQEAAPKINEFLEAPQPYPEEPAEEAIPQVPQSPDREKSPFLEAGSIVKSQNSDLKNRQKLEEVPNIKSQNELNIPDQYLTAGLKTEKPERFRSFPLGKTLFIVSAILVTVGAFLWGYTLWTARQKDTTPEVPKTVVEPVKPEPKIEEPIVEEIPKWPNKFSTTTPNYWVIPIESMTADAMTKIINDKASEAKTLTSSDLAEFYVTDSKNNPISFSAFAILAGINLPAQIYDSLEDQFSFYFYNDAGNVKAGISVRTKNSDKIIPLLSGAEKTMTTNLKPLLLGVADTNKVVKFSDSKHRDFSIRYYNLGAGLTSIDYAVTKSYLVIGTSLKTGRAILDKIQP